ncbi:hypothetical protein Vafri_2483 [Volvox africanus]|uniref:Uncharacterized protein n=1 Tax=Volvox africanus TaxID=51714 RepID=A0A8J4APR1_9CHLO|nr:hypothetical protein Vafri_2483 [Volvox africanus]
MWLDCAVLGRRIVRIVRTSSMLTAAMSFTSTATRRPSLLESMWLKSVVFPAPKKPDNTVTGSRSSASTTASCRLPRARSTDTAPSATDAAAVHNCDRRFRN